MSACTPETAPWPRADRPLRPLAIASARPWAGRRLGNGIGEHWVAGPSSTVALPDERTATLDELAAALGERLVGSRGLARYGARFPLLVKLIDAGDWLSLQVHPSDELARRRFGPDAVGKAEAWLVLDADPGAQLVVGPRPGLAADKVRSMIAGGTLARADCQVIPAVAGGTLHIDAGTIHAIGAGAFIYEIEEPSDITFRISDWGRPAVPGRHLHLEEALEAVRPELDAHRAGTGWRLDGGSLTAREFRLELVAPGSPAAARHPGGLTCEVVTAVRGEVALAGDGWTELLAQLATAVVPAAVGGYRIEGSPDAVAAVGSLP